MKYRISQAASIIPVAGYAVLWSEKFDGLLEYQKAWDASAWFTVPERLHMIYFGSISLTIALAIFYIFCPSIIRRQPTVEGYILEQLQATTHHVTQRADSDRDELISEKDPQRKFTEKAGYILRSQLKFEGALYRGMIHLGGNEFDFRVLYLQHEDKNLSAIITTYVFLIGGVFTFLLPSVEVFYLVIASIILT